MRNGDMPMMWPEQRQIEAEAVRYLDHRTKGSLSVDLGLIYKLCRLNDAPPRTASPPGASAKRHLTIVVAIAVMAGFGVRQLETAALL